MINYRRANDLDAEYLLSTRYNAVINNGKDLYPKNILLAWAPIINDETIAKESEALKNPDRITVVAEDYSEQYDDKNKKANKIVGLATLILSECSVMQCYVLPEYAKKGIGKELMNRIESIARKTALNC